MKARDLIVAVLAVVMVSCRSSKITSVSTQKEGDVKKVELVAAPSKKAASVIHAARKFTGTKYKYGGMDKSGMDCSGLVCNAFKEIDIQLPHQSSEMSKLGKSLKIYELQPGDLIFMGASRGSRKVTHVGIVTSVSNSKIMFIHASTQRGVIEENLLEKWYEPLFIKGARLF